MPGDWMSVSMTPTRLPARATSTARLAVVFDLAGAAAEGMGRDDFGQRLSLHSDSGRTIAGARRSSVCDHGPRKRFISYRSAPTASAARFAAIRRTARRRRSRSASRRLRSWSSSSMAMRIGVDLIHRGGRAGARLALVEPQHRAGRPQAEDHARTAAAPRPPRGCRSACRAGRRRSSIQSSSLANSVTWCRETCGSEMTMSRPSSRPIVISRLIGESPGLNRLALGRIKQLHTHTADRRWPVLVAHRLIS